MSEGKRERGSPGVFRGGFLLGPVNPD